MTLPLAAEWLGAAGCTRWVPTPTPGSSVDTIVRERLGGISAASDSAALARYVAFGIPRLQSPRVDTALAAQGQKVFAAKCAGCHQGMQMTSGNPDASSPLGGGAASGPMLYDVGTATDDAHVILGTFFESLFPPLEAKLFKALRGDRDLGPGDFVQTTLDFRPRPARERSEFKAPSLVGVWDNAIFFHDGRYDSLDGAVQHLDETLSLGLSKEDCQRGGGVPAHAVTGVIRRAGRRRHAHHLREVPRVARAAGRVVGGAVPDAHQQRGHRAGREADSLRSDSRREAVAAHAREVGAEARVFRSRRPGRRPRRDRRLRRRAQLRRPLREDGAEAGLGGDRGLDRLPRSRGRGGGARGPPGPDLLRAIEGVEVTS